MVYYHHYYYYLLSNLSGHLTAFFLITRKFSVLLQFTKYYSPHFILAAASFPEVSDWRELCVDGLGVEPAVVQVHDGFLCILLATKLHTGHTRLRFDTIHNCNINRLIHKIYSNNLICINSCKISTNLNVDVADKVVAQVIAHIHLLHLSILLFHLCEHLLCLKLERKQ